MLSKSFDFTLAPHMHEHPGENGNISLNEAAVVAAGFGFRRIRSVNDHPPSFSRPIAAYAMILNDNLQYVDRSELLPSSPVSQGRRIPRKSNVSARTSWR